MGSDLAARKSLGDQAQDHDLLRTEWFRGWFIAHVGSAAQLGQDGYSGLGVNRRLSAGDGANRAFEVKTFDIFDDKAARTRLDALRYQRFVGEGGQNNDGCFGVTFGNGTADIDAACSRQADVEQYHVRAQALD